MKIATDYVKVSFYFWMFCAAIIWWGSDIPRDNVNLAWILTGWFFLPCVISMMGLSIVAILKEDK